ncbi:biotin/lipoyl-containing protein, partial [Microbacterium sp. B35-30]
MAQDFHLPDLGEGLPEAELVQWQVAVGDTVALNQTIAEVETAKAVVELPSPYAGTVTALHAEAGDVIAVGSVLISFDTGGTAPTPSPAASVEASAPDTAASAPAPPATASEPNLVGYGAAPRGTGRPQRRARVA